MSAQNPNDDYWHKAVIDSDLYKDLKVLIDAGDAIATGASDQCLIFMGPGGIGKTHLFELRLNRAGRRHMRVKAGTVLGLLEDLQKCARRRMVALLDDPSREILEKEEFQKTLMAATGPAPRTYEYTTKNERTIYDFSGLTLVVLTNHNLRDEKRRATEQMQPLLSRFLSVSIEPTREEIFLYACYLAICERVLVRYGANVDRANQALKYFADNMHRLPDVSVRTLIKIVKQQKAFPTTWQAVMDRELDKGEPKHPRYSGKMPEIILDAGHSSKAAAPDNPSRHTSNGSVQDEENLLRERNPSEYEMTKVNAALQAKVEHLQEEIGAIHLKNNELETQALRLREERDAGRVELERVKAQLDALPQEHESERRQHEDLRIRVEHLYVENENAARKILDLESQLGLVAWLKHSNKSLMPAEAVSISIEDANRLDNLIRRILSDDGPEHKVAINVFKKMLCRLGVDLHTISFDWKLSLAEWRLKFFKLEEKYQAKQAAKTRTTTRSTDGMTGTGQRRRRSQA